MVQNWYKTARTVLLIHVYTVPEISQHELNVNRSHDTFWWTADERLVLEPASTQPNTSHKRYSLSHTHNRFTTLCPELPGWASTRRNTHPPTILIIIQSLSASSIYHDPNYVLGNFFCTTSLHVFFGLPLGLEPSTSYSIHFFTQSVSSFRSTCPYHHNLFCCSINIISSIPSLSLNSPLGTPSFTLTLHIHLTTLISTRRSATSFSFPTGQVSLPCSIPPLTQPPHNGR